MQNMSQRDIKIKYTNNTGEVDFQVCIFSKELSTHFLAAWEVIRAQSSASFIYPAEYEVGASYEQGDLNVILGPLTARLGSTWDIEQHNQKDTAVLSEGETSLLL